MATKTKAAQPTRLESLTARQEALLVAVGDEYIKTLTQPDPFDIEACKPWLTVVYGLYDKPLPARIEIADSPVAALALATQLTGEKQSTLDWNGLDDAGWVAFYDAMARLGVITERDDEPENAQVITMLKRHLRCAWDTVLLDECAIVIRRPTQLRLDDDGNLHAADGPCLEWANGEREWAWHGTWVPERIIMSPRSYTRAEYDAITNTEERRALCEAAGWDWIVDMLGAAEVNVWRDRATRLSYTLLRTADGRQFLKQQSPQLKRKSQPHYIEPVHESLKTAKAARKWQATGLSPEECESDPVLTYGIEA